LTALFEKNLILAAGVCFFIGSIVFYSYKKYNPAIAFLCLGSFLLFSYAALLDPFLNIWDERFHALVAKNLLQHPLMPTLYDDPVISMQYDRWDRAIIWLHKQPFFLWQISLCYKLFGTSEFTTRLPSVLLGSALILISYRTGKLLLTPDAGYYAAFLFATSYYLAELISGRLMVDHNDVSFLFYVSASIWAWVEYVFSGKTKWIIWVGIFSGIAVLCKWLVGLAVFSGWLSYIIYTNIKSNKGGIPENRPWYDFFIALLVTVIVALPWQLFIFQRYPVEAAFSYLENNLHFTSAVEGHRGPWWFYFYNIKTLYGSAILIVLPLAIFISLKRIKIKPLAVAFFSILFVVYIFFTLSKTKMPGFTFMISLPVFVSSGILMDYIFKKIENAKFPGFSYRLCILVILLLIGYQNLNLPAIRKDHSMRGPNMLYRTISIGNKQAFVSLKTTTPLNSVVFNLCGRTYVDCMFYSGFPSYNFIPSAGQNSELKIKNRTIVIFCRQGQTLPDYIQKDKSILVRRDVIGSCE
jgi:4-amino-4-deoxy-L-arabinose transferase